MSTPENTSKNRKLLDEMRDVMRLYKERIVAILSNSNQLSSKGFSIFTPAIICPLVY